MSLFTPSTRPTVLDSLAVDLDGALVRPDAESWDSARQAWQLAVDQRPAAVVQAASARDVALTVSAAVELGLQVAAQGTGHNAAPLGDLGGTILLRTSSMRTVHIDPVRRVARVEAGALWMDVTGAAAEHGLVALAGSAPDVGVVGYTLGGGLSWLGRSHGLASGSVVAAEVVTADGRMRRVDEHHDADLFWALRGGGGSFAVVTALEFALYPLTEIHAGVLFFPLEQTGAVLEAWRVWLPSVPETVTSVGRVLRFPPLPDLPPHLSGRSYAVIEVACQMAGHEADALLAPLRALGPALDTCATIPTTELAMLHMDPDGPVPAHGDGMLLGELTPESVAAFTRVAGPGSDLPLLSVELRHLGGALTPGRTEGALGGIDAEFAAFAVGMVPVPEAMAAVQNAVAAVQHALAPWATGGAYLNFAERPKAGDALFGTEGHRRLAEIKAAHDPRDVIRANHRIEPAAS
jgi:hypothetical protein